jgi:hypothetical protein
MKEQRITVEIDGEGRITADAEGFSGDACLAEIERLLDGLSVGVASVDRKADEGKVQRARAATQTVGKKP